MTVERWEHVKDLLHRALPLDPEQRAHFLKDACSSDDELRAEVESLLLADEGIQSSFMQSPLLADELSGAVGTLEPGQIFAQRFRLVRRLGEGGMGQVWLAEQTSPVRRQVALKLIKAGMYDEAVVQRFQSERQSLAIMDHPVIAKVFDAGATQQGQPYFVMEYVPGLAITEYCDQKKLKISDRLELFVQVCEGVQHAHQKAIIHRDLKPANILVVEVDGKPVPRIIDFGLAKATAPHVAGETVFTHLGHFVGTPGYMSPEQADPDVVDIDTRTDVYSMGVVLYELLAGLQPFETKPRQKQPLDELLRKLREEEPPRPSTKVGADRDTSAAIAQARGTEPKQLVSLLRGDLDWIAMRALEKDRVRRYGAPSELAADIRRYLNHEPVEARPASAGYRLRKYARRHRVAAGLVLLLAAFSVLQAVQLLRTTRERDRATRERDRATRITDFMTSMFMVSDPSEARGNSVTAREILDKASTKMATSLAKDPEAQSQMMFVMAGTYINLGLYPRAEDLSKRALDARLAILGPDDPNTLMSMTQLGYILNREGHYADAEHLARQALVAARRIYGPENQETAGVATHLAAILLAQGHYDEGEKLEREVVEIQTRSLGPENHQTLNSMNTLGSALLFEKRYAEAEKEYRQLVDDCRHALGADSPTTLAAMNNLAYSISWQGRFAEAEPLYREVLATEKRVLGPEHPDLTYAMTGVADCLLKEGRLSDSEKLYREALGICHRALGPENPKTLEVQSELVDVLLKEGHVQEGEKLQRETVAANVHALGPEHSSTLTSQASLIEILNREGNYAEAEKLAREIFNIQLRILGLQHSDTLNALQQVGTAMAHEHRYPEASKLFRDVIEKQDTSKGQGDRFSVWYSFACVAVAANHPDDALQYLREAIKRGYKDADGLTADDNLKSLRQNPHFQELVVELKHPPATIQTR